MELYWDPILFVTIFASELWNRCSIATPCPMPYSTPHPSYHTDLERDIMKAQWPKISILTPSYNQGKYIEQAIASVIDQRYPHFEHIIIDGGSEDNTLSLLKKYPHLKWISEKDRGQSDALNKALGMATGELVGWLNSDDYYAKETFERVRRRFDDDNVDWAILDVVNYYEQTGAEIYMQGVPP